MNNQASEIARILRLAADHKTQGNRAIAKSLLVAALHAHKTLARNLWLINIEGAKHVQQKPKAYRTKQSRGGRYSIRQYRQGLISITDTAKH